MSKVNEKQFKTDFIFYALCIDGNNGNDVVRKFETMSYKDIMHRLTASQIKLMNDVYKNGYSVEIISRKYSKSEYCINRELKRIFDDIFKICMNETYDK